MRKQRRYRPVDGILLLDKAKGITSNRALQQARAIFRAQKAGHTGSLDPLATGMLPLCFGEATKFSSWLLDADKCYTATCRLGEQTDTGDSQGDVVARSEIPAVTAEAIENVVALFRGRSMQTPPMYSALSVDGKRLYKLARAGKTVAREPREINISSLDLLDFDATGFSVEVCCSKGTYIRTLIEDIAREMGTCGHLTALRRNYVSPFEQGDMLTIDQLDRRKQSGENLDELLLPLDSGLKHLPACDLSRDQIVRLRQGQTVAAPGEKIDGPIRMLGEDGKFMGIVTHDGEQFKPKRLLRSDPADLH